MKIVYISFKNSLFKICLPLHYSKNSSIRFLNYLPCNCTKKAVVILEKFKKIF